MKSFEPNWASAPGETIADILRDMQWTHDEFARRLRQEKSFVTSLIDGQAEITNDIARLLAGVIGPTENFWIRREQFYREELVRLAEKKARQEKEWLQSLPIRDMVRFGWLRSGERTASACLDFFNAMSLDSWRRAYEERIVGVAFRASAAYDTNPASVAAWLRQGEIEAASVASRPWNRKALLESTQKIRSLTRRKAVADFVPDLREICAACGVAFVLVPAPEGCRASGAAYFLSQEQAVIQLSLRYKTDDQFWFSFFHEVGHLVLHRHLGLSLDGFEGMKGDEETEANAFAQDALLPSEQRERLAALPLNYKEIIRFARGVGVSPGIVVGQLQHSRRIGFERFNKVKRKYDWT